MPDRVIRDELLESERWLSLKDNADRLAYIALILKADDYGNFSAERYRLMRLWRDFGITTVELASKTLAELIDHELIGLYDVEKKPYLHIMRFRNARQYWSRRFPSSPFDEEKNSESKQQDKKIPITDLYEPNHNLSRGVGVGVKEVLLRSNKSDQDTLFDQFWKAYPKKVAKVHALKAWRKLNPQNGDFEKIMAGLEAQKKLPKWMEKGGEFIPHPATWLNGRRFEDDLFTEKPRARFPI